MRTAASALRSAFGPAAVSLERHVAGFDFPAAMAGSMDRKAHAAIGDTPAPQ